MSAHGLNQAVIDAYLGTHPFALVFVTVSGAHLYGFHSPDSDYDLRGMHAAPLRELVRLDPPDDTVEIMDKASPIEMDIVTHDIRKYFKLLLSRNGYVLEQIFSPLVVQQTPEFDELRVIARGAITRHHKYHYRGFAENQWSMVVRSGRPTVKGLLYTYRVLMAGIHLMRTGEVQPNLRILNESMSIAHIDDLIARKLAGAEKQELRDGELQLHEREFARLRDVLDVASEKSHLPSEPSCRAALDDLLVRIRMRHQ